MRLANAGYEGDISNTGDHNWRVVLPLQYRKLTWTRKLVDEGYYTLAEDEFAWEPILDSDGNLIAQPAYLDGNGLLLDPGADAVLLEYDIDDEADFGPLLDGIET